MVNKKIWLGILATVLVFGMMVVGCGDDSTDDIEVTLERVTQNGSESQTTTQLTLTFSQTITGLSESDITLSGLSGVQKGTLSGSGPSYTLPISGFTTRFGTLAVAVAKTGYTISGSPYTLTIFYSSGGGDSGGTFTLNDIPSEFNGKYTFFQGGDAVTVVGADSVNLSTGRITASPISNGSVSIPLRLFPSGSSTTFLK